MTRNRFINVVISIMVIVSLTFGGTYTNVSAQQKATTPPQGKTKTQKPPVSSVAPEVKQNPAKRRLTPAERQAAADRAKALGQLPGVAASQLPSSSKISKNGAVSANLPDASVTPHYFGPYANYANSPLPKGPITSITVDNGGSGYSATPSVYILDAYGTGLAATAEAVVVGGVIQSINVTDGGADYSAPLIVIEDVSGVDAAATPIIGETPGSLTGGIRKFMDSLPGLGPTGESTLGNYIPVGVPDTETFGAAFNPTYASHYYEIALVEYTQQLHRDLPPTTLRGYVQLETSVVTGAHVQLYYPDGSPIYYPGTTNPVFAVDQPRYLGPTLVASKGTPVRIKFYNFLPNGAGGDLFVPVDETVMGAGEGPLDEFGNECDPMLDVCAQYSQNRATLHNHGALVPWISDGTPHQWITPNGEDTQYPKGVSVSYVPDMWFDANGNVVSAGTPGASNNPGDGAMTFYYNNDQGARLLFYHDHAYGITRLNVYVGEAAGYLITDEVEADLIGGTNVTGVNPDGIKALPDLGIPLVIQDKSFVDATTIAAQDPTWRWGTGDIVGGRREPKTGDLWVSSVYMPIQNPNDPAGANAYGRWQYGPWFNPPTGNLKNFPNLNPYYDPNCDSGAMWCEPQYQPNVPNPSMGMESYNDTSMVNGAAYPYMEVDPTTVRFRVLNAGNDRFLNLQMYKADPTIVTSDGRTKTEVTMLPAVPTAGFPELWPTDGRAGGVPDPATAGPEWIQIGTEGGFLPAPVVIPQQPITWQQNPGLFNVGNVLDHSLLLGNAERADVLVDFSAYAGQTLILYNDAPTAFPALDPRYDYYTGSPNQMDSGGAPTTQAGYGPNTRTIMQIRVRAVAEGPLFSVSMADLESVFAKDNSRGKAGVFEAAHPDEPIIIPQAAYDSAYDENFPTDALSQYVQIGQASKTFTPLGTNTPVNIVFETKGIHDEMGGVYDSVFGRMSGMLGLDISGTNSINQNILLYGYASPPTDVMQDSMTPIGTLNDGTQIWKIMHNGVDTHPIHFHLFNVQLINRVGWDGLLMPPEANELGWKETIRVNPLEDTIVAIRPKATDQPFEIPNSIRPIDPTIPIGAPVESSMFGFITPGKVAVVGLNHMVNYGWEYVWHCHILSHEEMDMMHSLAFAVSPLAPSNLTASDGVTGVDLTWTDNSVNETEFTLQRTSGGVTTNIVVPSTTGPETGAMISYTDTTAPVGSAYSYVVLGTNVVGDTFVYDPTPGALNFPTKTMNSDPSNTAANMVSVASIIRASANPTSAASVNFTVTFTDTVATPATTDFALTGIADAEVASVTAVSGTVYTVTVNTGTVNGTLRLDLINTSLGGPFINGESYIVEKTPPLAASILRASADPAGTNGVNFTVTFDKAVTGVDVADFSAVTTGTFTVAPAVTLVSGTGTTYTVTVGNYKSNSGTLGLNLVDNDSIVDVASIPLGGSGLVNGDYTGEVYAIDNVAPTVVSSVRVNTSPTLSDVVNYTVTFSEPVTGVDKGDFKLLPTITGALVTTVTPVSAAVYTVTVNTGTGAGTMRLNTIDNNTIQDTLHHFLGGEGSTYTYTSGESYVLSAAGVRAYDDTHVNWTYTGSWTAAAPYTGSYNNTTHYSFGAGNSATVLIDSQRFKLVYTSSSSRGMVDVFVDDVKIATINQYSGFFKYQETWTSPILSAGPHTVRFALASGYMIDIDAIQVMSAPYTTPSAITNLTAALGTIDGSVDLAWTAVGNDGMTGTASSYQVRYGTTPITTQALWDAATIVIDVPTPSASGTNESLTVSDLPLQQKYYFAVRALSLEGGLGALSNSSSSFAKPATLTAGVTYDDTNINWMYSGNWTAAAPYTGTYNNTTHYSFGAGNSATVLIDSQRFKLVYTSSPSRGMADVFVDDVKIATINQYSGVVKYQETWTSPILSAGPHTVRLVLLSGYMIDIDAIQVMSAPYTTPSAITNLTAALGTIDGSVDLAWTAVGNEGMTGTASSYQVRYGTTPITTQALWDAATIVIDVPTPSASGTNESLTVSDLPLQQKYYFAVRALSLEGGLGALSNSSSSFAKPATLTAGVTYDDTNINWMYSGNWTAAAPYTGAYNNTTHYSFGAGNSATVLIDSQSFTLVYTSSSSRGMVDVFVDDVKIATINEYSGLFKRQETWTSPILSAGPHTVRFALASGYMIEVDAIQIP